MSRALQSYCILGEHHATVTFQTLVLSIGGLRDDGLIFEAFRGRGILAARLYNIAVLVSLPLIWCGRLIQECPDLGCAEDLKLDTEHNAAWAAEAPFKCLQIKERLATLNRTEMPCEDVAMSAFHDAIELGREKGAERGFKAIRLAGNAATGNTQTN